MTSDADATTEGESHFWDSAADGRLEFQQCSDCGYVRWPVAGVCPECLGRAAEWIPVEGLGTLWSVVVYHRSYSREGLPAVPYNVALVELDCGARMLTRLVGEDWGSLGPGDRVVVDFQELPGVGRVPVFAKGDVG